MPLRSTTMPAHSARPAQSCPIAMDNWTSSVVRQWTTARGMGPTGFAQIAVAAA